MQHHWNIQILGLLFCILVNFGSINAYTVTQYDRQWVDSLRHSAMYYHNLDWERRQRYRQLVAFAQDQAAAPRKQIEPLVETDSTLHQDSANIAKSLIYGRNFDII